jgi:myo-inositol-1(or 4)-monophosphatase
MKYTEFLELSKKVTEEVRDSIKKISSDNLRLEVGMGKDGTPTKKVDKVAEDAALKILKEYDFRVVSEESGVMGDGDIFVALDPVDGTFNATRGIPIYSISMCFSKSERLCDTFFAYVSNLSTGTEYYASGEWNNGKAFRDGERIYVSNEESIHCNAIFYYPRKNYGFRRIRIFGSAALELCFVAEGSVDCFIDIRNSSIYQNQGVSFQSAPREGLLRIYDVAAGVFISRCANAVTTDIHGNLLDSRKINMDERLTLLVANEKLHKNILKVFKGEK